MFIGDRTALMTIEDTRIRISPTEQIQIFERFDRLNSDRSRQSGTEAIAKAIVHHHQGEDSI